MQAVDLRQVRQTSNVAARQMWKRSVAAAGASVPAFSISHITTLQQLT